MRWQLEAYRNEVELLKREQRGGGGARGAGRHEEDPPVTPSCEVPIQILQQNMHHLQQVGRLGLETDLPPGYIQTYTTHTDTHILTTCW